METEVLLGVLTLAGVVIAAEAVLLGALFRQRRNNNSNASRPLPCIDGGVMPTLMTQQFDQQVRILGEISTKLEKLDTIATGVAVIQARLER